MSDITIEQKKPVYTQIGENTSLHLVLKNASKSVKSSETTTKVLHIVSLVLIYAFLIVAALIFLFPFYWMIITSFKSGDEIRGFVPGHEGEQTFWPLQFVNNYANLNSKIDFAVLIPNTLIVGVLSTLGTILTCILSAFAFSKLQFKGRDTLFTLFLATMMIPGEMMTVTNYITVSNLGWVSISGNKIGAFLAMIIPFMVSVFYIYLLRQNFLQIPNELYLAAKVDGKSDWNYLWKVLVPLAMPTLITIFILKLIGTWNSYMWPNLISQGDKSIQLISNGLRNSFQTGTDFDEYGRQMAATVIVTVPLLILFIIFRKYIMRGVSRAGIKG